MSSLNKVGTSSSDVSTEQNDAAFASAIPEFNPAYANRVLVLFSLLAAFVLFVDIMLTPSLPIIASDYKVSIAEVSLIISLYTVFGTAVNPMIGKLGDIVGKKRVLIYVLIIYCVMVAVTSFATSFTLLLISRTIQGIGLGIFPLAFSLVREEFPREMVPRAQGILSAMFGAGAAFGLPIGALIANSYGWQANYHVALPFIAVLTILIFFMVRESSVTNPNASLDYVGAVWVGLTLGAIVFGLSDGSTNSKNAVVGAAQFSKLMGATLMVLHILYIPEIAYAANIPVPLAEIEEGAGSRGERVLEEAASLAEVAGTKATCEMRKGVSPAQGIVDYAEASKADLIILGARGLGGFKKLLMGSVSNSVLHYSGCSVLVVR